MDARPHSLENALFTIKTNSADKVTIADALTVAGALRLANRARGSKVLRTLCLNSCSLNDDIVVIVSDILKHSSVRTLYVGHNRIGATGVRALVEASLYAGSLQILSLYGNDLGNEGARTVAVLLPSIRLISLDLSRNSIGDEGALALAAGLRASHLRDLLLSDNNISDVAGVALARSVHENARIECLDLQGNAAITDVTAGEMLLSLQTHGSLRNVTLSPGTAVSEHSCQDIHRRMQILHSMRAKLMTVMCSAMYIPRLGKNSPCQWLSPDLIRAICDVLTFDDNL